MKRPFETWVLYLFLMLLSANAFYGGISLILATAGSLLGINTGWLEKSPFNSFLIPGILLTLFMGIFPVVTLFGLLTKNRNPHFHILNIYPEKHWGWTYSLYCGITTIFWIVVQQLLTEYFILQPIIAGVGLFIIIFTLMPRIQKYYNLIQKRAVLENKLKKESDVVKADSYEVLKDFKYIDYVDKTFCRFKSTNSD